MGLVEYIVKRLIKRFPCRLILSTKRAISANPTTISGFFQNIDGLYKVLKLADYPVMASRFYRTVMKHVSTQQYGHSKS